MSRAEQEPRGGDSRDLRHAPSETAPGEATSVAAFLRAVAARAERDPTFARQLAEALRESGLVLVEPMPAPTQPPAPTPVRDSRAGRTRRDGPAAPPSDPYVILRTGGEPALRAALNGLDLAALRQVVRVCHLDPNRVSARWSARDRIIALIVDQVRARAEHGRSFERV